MDMYAGCGEVLEQLTMVDKQQTTREGRTTITRELVTTRFHTQPKSYDLTKWIEHPEELIRDQYEIISDFSRLFEIVLSNKHYDRLLKGDLLVNLKPKDS